jgi:hypothetical protein
LAQIIESGRLKAELQTFPRGGTTMIGIVQLRKSYPISIALIFVGAMLALILSFGTSAQQTLFTDDFEDGNANGWSKCGGR